MKSNTWLNTTFALPVQLKDVKNVTLDRSSFGSAVIRAADGLQDSYVAGGCKEGSLADSAVMRYRVGQNYSFSDGWHSVSPMQVKRSHFNLVTVKIPAIQARGVNEQFITRN